MLKLEHRIKVVADGKRDRAHRLIGHIQTIAPTLRHGLLRFEGPSSSLWTTTVPNEFGDEILHSGQFCDVVGSRALVVILHGLGGNVDRGYCLQAAGAAHRAGLPSLRLSLRGSDGRGRDFHHAGFTDDLGPLLAKGEWKRFEKIAVVGFSLGGHVALRAAVDTVDGRLAAVAAICPPLNLRASQEWIDGGASGLYRRSVLKALKAIYPHVARGGRLMTPVERIEEVSTLREWDALTVVPRFGFDDVDHYYATQSVGPRLASMKTPALVVASPADPMIPADSLRGPLGRASAQVEVRWVRGGGHVFFPARAQLGFGPEAGVPSQVMNWVAAQLRD